MNFSLTAPVTYYDADYERQTARLPAHWVICDDCQGSGRSSAYLGDFSMEALDDDPDFKEAYFAGEYDRACPACAGSGKRAIVDRRACQSRPEFRKLLRAADAYERAEAEVAREAAAERRAFC